MLHIYTSLYRWGERPKERRGRGVCLVLSRDGDGSTHRTTLTGNKILMRKMTGVLEVKQDEQGGVSVYGWERG